MVRIYTTQSCVYCVRAKQLLTDRGVSFEEIFIPWSDDVQWDFLHRMSGMRTMPQIFNGDILIGGYTELARLDKNDQLAFLRGHVKSE